MTKAIVAMSPGSSKWYEINKNILNEIIVQDTEQIANAAIVSMFSPESHVTDSLTHSGHLTFQFKRRLDIKAMSVNYVTASVILRCRVKIDRVLAFR